jgi:hypothetical protein
MESKKKTVEQCKLAFDFIEKLFMEVSYFIKEVEGLLQEEGFIIGRPSGYQISARGSSGLETINVKMWLLKKLAVFFAPQDLIKGEKGQTSLSVESPTTVVYLRVVLHDEKLAEPTVYAGVLYNVQKGPNTKWLKKFEQAIQHIEYNDAKIFKGDLQHLEYEDSNIRFKGHLHNIPLFELNDGDAILNRIVTPCLALYTKHRMGE